MIRTNQIQALHVICEPGNATRYDLTIASDPHGGFIVTWPAMRWAAWASDYPGGEIRPFPKPKGARLSKADLTVIGEVLDKTARLR